MCLMAKSMMIPSRTATRTNGSFWTRAATRRPGVNRCNGQTSRTRRTAGSAIPSAFENRENAKNMTDIA